MVQYPWSGAAARQTNTRGLWPEAKASAERGGTTRGGRRLLGWRSGRGAGGEPPAAAEQFRGTK